MNNILKFFIYPKWIKFSIKYANDNELKYYAIKCDNEARLFAVLPDIRALDGIKYLKVVNKEPNNKKWQIITADEYINNGYKLF